MKLSESEARKIINLNPRGAIDKDIAERQFQVALKGFNALIQPDTDFLYIADEVGLGKTYIALAIASLLRHFCPPEHRDIYQDVIFVPKRNLQYKWLKEIKNFIGSNFLINGNIVKSALDIPVARCSEESVHHYLELYQDSSSYEIFRNSSFSIASSSHYDWKSKLKERLPLDKQLIFAKGIKIYRKAEDEVLLRRLFAFIMNTAWPEIDLLIVDEAHNYKHGINGSSYRNQVVSRLLGVVQDEDRARLFVDFPELKDQVQKKLIKAIFLSATPIDNGLYEIKQQMDCFFPRHQFSDSINVDEDVGKHIRSFMIRGVMNISVGNEQNVSRNMYRYEHRRGNVEKVANAKPQYLEDELESLIIGLIQYETIQYFGSTKRKSFEIGMLAGFETFSLDDVEEDKEYEESSDRKNNRSVDHNVIQVIAKSYFDEFSMVVGDESHLFKAKSLTSIMSKLKQCPYRFGTTGTLDDSQTHKLVIEGLFGPVLKVATTKQLMDKKLLVFIFIIFHLTSIIIWNLDIAVGVPDEIVNLFEPYMYGLSLWQAWNIFSPDVYTKETSTRIIIETENKTVSYLHAYAKEGMPLLFTRFRKFNDNIISNKDPRLNTAYLVYLCKYFNKIYQPGYEITLEILYKDINFHPKNEEAKVSYEPLGGIRCS